MLIGGKEIIFVCKMFNVQENRPHEERNAINITSNICNLNFETCEPA